MIRRILLPVLMALAAPAAAGIQATYKAPGEDGVLRIMVADNGDASFTVDGDDELRLLVANGRAYMIGETEDGRPKAIAFAAAGAALGVTGAPLTEEGRLDEPLPVFPKAALAMKVTPLGRRVVSGRLAQGFRLSVDKETLEINTLADPAFAPLGKAMAVLLADAGDLLATIVEDKANMTHWIDFLRRTVELGTPLSMTDAFELTSIEELRVPPETIALPGKPVEAEELISRIRGRMPGS